MSRIDPEREARAVASLRESLAAMGEDDEALLIDSIEGQTNLFECIDLLLERMSADVAFMDGLDSMIATLKGRKERFDKRIAANRAVIEQAMVIADLAKLERPAATLSLSQRAAKLVVTEESDIPAAYWKAADPVLDKKSLLAALKDGTVIPGAALDNAAPTLTVRQK